jgi:hypothetical protein
LARVIKVVLIQKTKQRGEKESFKMF